MNTPGIHLKKAPFSASHVNKLIGDSNYDQAEKILRKELKKKPNNYEALHLLGMTLWHKENEKGALVFLQRAMTKAASQQQLQQTALALSNIYASKKQHSLAIQAAEKGLKGQYEDTPLTAKLVKLYLEAQDHGKVSKIIKALMPLKDVRFEALKIICLAYQSMGDIEHALELAQAGVDYFPESAALVAQFCNEKGDFEKPEPLLEKALVLRPEGAALNILLANLYYFYGRKSEAVQLLSGISRADNLARVKRALGSLYLADADFIKGHELLEARYSDPGYCAQKNILKSIDFNGQWLESLENILVSKEEGVGDQIRHAKYLSMLPANIREKIFVNCDDRLIPLFKSNFPELKFISSLNVNLAYMAKHNITHQILLASTYFLTGEKMQQAKSAYLSAGELDQLIPNTQKMKIGLCWRSVKVQLDRTLWYMPLEEVAALFKDIDCELVSLQNDVTDEELEIIKLYSGKDLVVTDIDAKDDFLGLSQLINETGLVISTATATSELAGSLGKKTWVIGNKHPVRWYLSQVYMDHFYPDMQLYLSTQAFDWKGVAIQIEKDLKAYVKEFAGK